MWMLCSRLQSRLRWASNEMTVSSMAPTMAIHKALNGKFVQILTVGCAGVCVFCGWCCWLVLNPLLSDFVVFLSNLSDVVHDDVLSAP